MLVYRVCSKEEVDFILANGDMSIIGGREVEFWRNTHKYIPREKYMHFFPNEGNVLLVGQFPGSCICVYDIPDELLESGLGTYVQFPQEVTVEEFVVRSKLMKKKYLKQVKVAKDWLNTKLFMEPIPDDLLEIIYKYEGPTFGGR